MPAMLVPCQELSSTLQLENSAGFAARSAALTASPGSLASPSRPSPSSAYSSVETKSRPGSTWASSSGWRVMPVSSTATTALALPVSLIHALWKPGTPRKRSASALALLPLTLLSHHWLLKYGSPGTCKRRSRSFATTHSTSGRALKRAARRSASAPASTWPKSRCSAERPTGRRPATATAAASMTRCMRALRASAGVAPGPGASESCASCAGASLSLTIRPWAERSAPCDALASSASAAPATPRRIATAHPAPCMPAAPEPHRRVAGGAS